MTFLLELISVASLRTTHVLFVLEFDNSSFSISPFKISRFIWKVIAYIYIQMFNVSHTSATEFLLDLRFYHCLLLFTPDLINKRLLCLSYMNERWIWVRWKGTKNIKYIHLLKKIWQLQVGFIFTRKKNCVLLTPHIQLLVFKFKVK